MPDSRQQPPTRSVIKPRLAGIGYLSLALLAILVTLLGWGLRERIPLLQNLEGQVLDAQIHARGPIIPAAADGQPAMALLLIDDPSIREIGSLPIDRHILAEVVDRLQADGAATIIFDMLFSEPSAHGEVADQAFAAAIARAGNVVLAYALPDEAAQASSTMLSSGPILDSAYRRYRNQALGAQIELAPKGVLAPIPALAETAQALGHVSALTTTDGALRYDLPALPFDGEWLPSLAIVSAAQLSETPWDRVEAQFADHIEIGATEVPIDARSRQWVNYYGPAATFPTYSLADYAFGRLDPARFQGRIVLIGGTALGTNDRNLSPFDPLLPGVERIATVIDNLMTKRWLERPIWGAPVVLLLILLLPLVAVALVAKLPPLRAILVLALIGLAIIGLSQLLLVQQQQIVSMVFPLIALTLAGGSGLTWRARLDSNSRRQAEQALRASEQRYALAATGANDGLWDWDIVNDAVYLSARARDLLGPESAPANQAPGIGQLLDLLDQVERAECEQELEAHLSGQTGQFNRLVALERGGERRWLLIRGVAVREGDHEGDHEREQPVRMAGSLTDLTEQKRLERQLAFDALHDRLTGLANRDLFTDRVNQWLGSAQRSVHADQAQPDQTQPDQAPDVGLVLLDIDGFRAINEDYGQLGGNAVLTQLASRLSTLKTEGILVSRLGADQFALAFRGPDTLGLAERAQRLVADPFQLDADQKPIPISISQAHSAQGLSSTDELLAAATLALTKARQAPTGQPQRYDPAMQQLETSRRWLAENIDRALAHGDQFQLHYQPFVALADRRLLGFEALIRWQHPERGQIMPGEFIPFAEESGQINAVGQWALFEAVRQLVAWDQLGFKGELAVNLSGRQFTETDLLADAANIIEQLGPVAPGRYKLEVTESMAMDNPQQTTEILKALANLGLKISIDDFGTGYSSLAYLHRFPFHTLKIDRSFVMRLDAGREPREIVKTIVGLGVALDKQVLAEGIEDEQQASTLRDLGVQVGQGWLFARALPSAEATALVQNALRA
ncbi:MAG: EAL domain-containing protein [Lamprobacter sp.]|uniref:EAL domain-containing protein n=1 Tax=Lamprobacter sp. TaxID=3100796 RepID=UPI002B256BAD|nr:EAL domain-containing protein [Lamprobacter sp.]MEA3639086.1 EAL domain-containing protein [Lamprobacter sp.]